MHTPAHLLHTTGMNTKREIGKRLRFARERMGWTLQQVCDRVPLLSGNPAKLSNYEHGHRCPDIDMLKLLARALNVDCAWLATLLETEPDRTESLLTDYYRHSDTRGKTSILQVAELQASYDGASTDSDAPDP